MWCFRISSSGNAPLEIVIIGLNECAHAYPGQRGVNHCANLGGRTGLLVVLMAAFPTIGIAAYAYRTKRQVSELVRLPNMLHMAATSFSPRNLR